MKEQRKWVRRRRYRALPEKFCFWIGHALGHGILCQDDLIETLPRTAADSARSEKAEWHRVGCRGRRIPNALLVWILNRRSIPALMGGTLAAVVG
jgi:hypothetical protein